MTELRYPTSAVSADLLRALAGVTLCALLLLGASPVPWLAAVLGVGCALFLGFGLRCAMRLRHRFELHGASLEVVHRGLSLPWSQLRRLRLNYYSTRRDNRDGWLELQLRFANAQVRVDSRLLGFDALLRAALATAAAAGLDLDAATRRNLQSLGLDEPRPLAQGDPRGALPDA